MKHTFYRPTEVNCREMQVIVDKLKTDFQTLTKQDVSKEDCMAYAQSVVSTGLPLPKDPTMIFWGLQAPQTMPSDARVDFFYMPTYYTMAILIYMLEQGRIEKESIPEFETVLCGGLKACAGRHMMGHGYESTEGLLDALEVFQAAGAFAFCKKHPNVCPAFVECLLDGYDFIKHSLTTNRTRGEWGTDYATRMASLVEMVENREKGFVIVGGVLEKYIDAEAEVIVPEGVTEIGEGAFRDCKTVVSVELPSTLTAIGERAFENCTGLETICIPDAITDIEEFTFANCSSLRSITLPASLKYIEYYAFEDCVALKEIEIPEGVEYIMQDAFRNCKTMVSVQLPSTVTTIGWAAFFGCTGLESICIPDGISVVADNAFAWCRSLRSITLPASLKRIEANVFRGCVALEEIEIPEGVEYIMEDVFYDCIALKKVVMADTVKYLGGGAFEGCTSLKDVVLSANLKDMDVEAFQNCTSLEEIRLPESIVYLGNYLFNGCTGLKSIEIPENVLDIWENEKPFAFDGCDAEVYVYGECRG